MLLLIYKYRIVFSPGNAIFYLWLSFQEALNLLLQLSQIIKSSSLLTQLQMLLFKTREVISKRQSNISSCKWTPMSLPEALNSLLLNCLHNRKKKMKFSVPIWNHCLYSYFLRPWNFQFILKYALQLGEFTKSIEYCLVLILNMLLPQLLSH